MKKEKKFPIQSSEINITSIISKGILGSIPLVGSLAVETFDAIISRNLQERQKKWLENLYNELEKLKKEDIRYNINQLDKNNNFVTIFLNAYQKAIKTHQYEKHLYLKNVTINSVTSELEISRQIMFTNFLETFTYHHINILREVLSGSLSSQTDDILDIINTTKMGIPDEIFTMIIRDLDIKGMFKHQYHMISKNNMYNAKSKAVTLHLTTSQLAKEFLEYINRNP